MHSTGAAICLFLKEENSGTFPEGVVPTKDKRPYMGHIPKKKLMSKLDLRNIEIIV